MNFIKLFLKDNTYYSVDVSEWDKIYTASYSAFDGFIRCKFAFGDFFFDLDPREIQSFYIWSPELRDASEEWEASLTQEEKKPWE